MKSWTWRLGPRRRVVGPPNECPASEIRPLVAENVSFPCCWLGRRVQFIGVTADTSDSDKGRLRIRESILCAPTAPRPRLGILRRLERRCGGRHSFHNRCADRNGTCTRSTSNRKPSRQAEKEECVTRGYLLDPGGAPTGYASLPITGRRDVL